MWDDRVQVRRQADRWWRAGVARLLRVAANGRRDGCALLAQLSAACVAALLLWTGSRRVLELGGAPVGLLVAAVWLATVAGALWWGRAFWSPRAELRAAEADALAGVAAVRAGARRSELGLAAPLARVRSLTRELPASDRSRLRRRALAVARSAELVLADALEAGLVDLDGTGRLRSATEDTDALNAVRELLERRRLELRALVEELELRCGAGVSVRARLVARLEVDRCDATSPVVAMAAGGPS